MQKQVKLYLFSLIIFLCITPITKVGAIVHSSDTADSFIIDNEDAEFDGKAGSWSETYTYNYPFTGSGTSTNARNCGQNMDFTPNSSQLSTSGIFILSVARRFEGVEVIVNDGNGGSTTVDYEPVGNDFSNGELWVDIGTYTLYPGASVELVENGSCIRADAVRFTAVSPQCTTGEVGGYIWQDFEGDGLFDRHSYLPKEGISVKAYDQDNQLLDTTVSDESGYYTFSGLSSSQKVRVEIDTVDSLYTSTSKNSTSNTSMQFLTEGTDSACQGGFAIQNNDNVCVNNDAQIAATNFFMGDPLQTGTTSSRDTILTFSYEPTNRLSTNSTLSNTSSDMTLTSNSTAVDTGAVWGLAYHQKSDILFASAALKRGMAYGTLGTGGIYKVTSPASGSAATSEFLDLNSYSGISSGIDTHVDLDGDGLDFGSSATPDNASSEYIGKLSLGDIDIDQVNDYLFVANLSDQTVYGLPIGETPSAPLESEIIDLPVTITQAPCYNTTGGVNAPGDIQIWALKFYEDKLYAGVTCSAETSQDTTDLHAYIIETDPYVTTPSWSAVYDFTLDYSRDISWSYWDHTTTSTSQPLLSDIEFDIDGSIIAGIADRASMFSIDTSIYSSKGDTVRICKNFSTGVYSLESSGKCPESRFNRPLHDLNGSAEFYQDARDSFAETSLGSNALLPGKNELLTSTSDPFDSYSAGVRWNDNEDGIKDAALELYEDRAGTDTQDFAASQGIGDIEILCSPPPIEIGDKLWYDDNSDGIQDTNESPVAGVTINLEYADSVIATAVTNGSGEYLFKPLSAVISNPTTSDVDPNTADEIGYIIGSHNLSTPGAITDGYEYKIVIPNTTDNFGSSAPLEAYTSTQSDYYGGTAPDSDYPSHDYDAVADISDSDGSVDLDTGDVYVEFLAQTQISNDHSFDIGFVSRVPRVGNLIWNDQNGDHTYQTTEPTLAGVEVELYSDDNSDGEYTDGTDTLIDSTTTNSNGEYLLEANNFGDYIILIPQSNFASGEALENYVSTFTTGTLTDPDNDTDDDNNGQTITNYGVASKAVTLEIDSEPTLELMQPKSSNTEDDYSYDADSNLTIDFGFRSKAASIKGTVWDDLNVNQTIDSFENKLSGVRIDLQYFGVDGIKDTSDDITYNKTTGTNGTYQFNNLYAGKYKVSLKSQYIPSGKQMTTPDSINITLSENQTANNKNFGVSKLGQVSNVIYVDENSNSKYDDGTDKPFVGVKIKIYIDENNNGIIDSGDTLIDSTTTDANGYYEFSNLTLYDENGDPLHFLISIDTTGALSAYAANFSADQKDGFIIYSLNLDEEENTLSEQNLIFIEPEDELIQTGDNINYSFYVASFIMLSILLVNLDNIRIHREKNIIINIQYRCLKSRYH